PQLDAVLLQPRARLQRVIGERIFVYQRAPHTLGLVGALERVERTPAPVGALSARERARHFREDLEVAERAFDVALEPAREAEVPARVVAELRRAVLLERVLEPRDRLFVLGAVEVEPADEERGLRRRLRARVLLQQLAIPLLRLVVLVGARPGARSVKQRVHLAIVAGQALPHTEQLL